MKTILDKHQVRALGVEVSSKYKWECMNQLLNLYSRKLKQSSKYPNGIQLHFVKLKKDGINMTERSKMDKLRHRQKVFLDSIGTYTTHDILQLDYSSDAGKIPTLHQMIMEIRSKDGVTNLFHSVDMDWRQDGFIFQFAPAFTEEAETTINTLIPYLSYLFPNADVGSYFTDYAEERSQHMIYDPNKNGYIHASR